MKFTLFFRADQKAKMGQTALFPDDKERQTLLFLTTAVCHVLQKADALKGLLDHEKSFHVSRLVTQTMKGLVSTKGQIPNLKKAKTLAKVVVKDLRGEYGDKLKYFLLSQEREVQSVIVFCLRRHTKKMFVDRYLKESDSGVPFVLTIGAISAVVLFVITVL